MLGIELVMDGFGLADFLTTVKQLLGDERLMFTGEPLDLACP